MLAFHTLRHDLHSDLQHSAPHLHLLAPSSSLTLTLLGQSHHTSYIYLPDRFAVVSDDEHHHQSSLCYSALNSLPPSHRFRQQANMVDSTLEPQKLEVCLKSAGSWAKVNDRIHGASPSVPGTQAATHRRLN